MPRKEPNHLLKQARIRRNWTQAKLAELIELGDSSTIGRWENGKATPSLYFREKLCNVFDMSAEELGLSPNEGNEQQSMDFHDNSMPSPSERGEQDPQRPIEPPKAGLFSDSGKKTFNGPVISPPSSFQRHFPRRAALGGIAMVAVGGVAALGWFWRSSHSGQSIATPTPIPIGTTFLIHEGGQVVTVVSWSPNGKYIASTGDNGTIQVWDANSGKLATTYNGHASREASSLAWSHDSRFIASGGSDKTVHIWGVATNTTIYTYSGHSQAVNTVAWSPNDTRMASGGDDKQVHVWDSFSGSNVVAYKGHTALIHGVSWSPDGLSIVSASNDRTLQVWNALTAKRSLTYSGHTDLVYGVAWSPGGIHIASVGADGTVQVWDPIAGVPLFIFRGHTSYTIDVTWSPDSGRIASSSFDNTVRIWDVTTGKELYVYRGHTNYVFGVSWSPDGKRIASAGSYDGTVRVWKAP